MAQKVQVLLLDDVDGNEAAETVTFGLDGVEYEIDLSADNARAMREALTPWIGHARKATGGRVAASRSSAAAPRRSASSRSTSGSNASEMRRWAREHGFQVSERGRISEQIREAYAAAH
jgi:hypothetical protein